MSVASRAACEAAAWAFAGVFLASGVFFVLWRASAGFGDLALLAAVHGLVGALTAFIGVATLVMRRFPGNPPVVGAGRGAALGVLVTVVVPMVSVLVWPGSGGLLHSIFGQVFWSVGVAGGPFALAGALLGRRIEKRLFGARPA
ncbi:hypothetical protein [Piscinibacterium candidicorallinum]|uniref:Uncharacterized protein n=1 Tax=Piscinibacterium candidicorallinum TaxID=1793872 RepID=A0ABV7GYP5_9BURK